MSRTKESIGFSVVVLAAGLGKRMRSKLPKVLHQIAGKPLLFHVLHQIQKVWPDAPIAVVVGHARENVEEYVRNEPAFKSMKIQFIYQAEQKGTGHAARCAMDSEWGNDQVRMKRAVLVLPGDLPLIQSEMIKNLIIPLKKSDALRLLVCRLTHPTGYGRIVRKRGNGAVLRIVEEKDASPKEKLISEVATSIYLFESQFLQKSLRRLSSQNAQSEYYLTDVISFAVKAKKKIDVLSWEKSEDLQGVNDLWELSLAEKALNLRLIRHWASHGVKFVDPGNTKIDFNVQLEEGALIHPGVILSGETKIGSFAQIGPYCNLKDMEVSEGAIVKVGTVGDQSFIGPNAQVGPYAHLRPESRIGSKAKIGNFVELKKTKIGDGTSVAHLSYLGDAEVGKNVNIGCGFVTCNFDGRVIDGERKHRTIIEDDVFMGSDCQTVAPVRIGRGAFVASGSTITENVLPEDLAIARSRQVNKSGYARRLKQPKEE